jgi:pimeloyl-ACP methyl ester carboxylesterase
MLHRTVLREGTVMPECQRPGTIIHYELEGTGEPLVLLHGAFASLETWRFEGEVQALASDFRLVLIDLRGHGKTTKHSDPSAYLLGEQVADVVAVLDALEIRCACVCGFSQGAIVAANLTAAHPERVKALVTIGLPPWNIGFDDAPRRPADVEWIADLSRHGMAGMIASAEAGGHREWAAMFRETDPAAMVALLRSDDLEPAVSGHRIADITVPMTCIWGEQDADPLPPLPAHARVVIVPNEDHPGPLHHPDEVAAAIRALVDGRAAPVPVLAAQRI